MAVTAATIRALFPEFAAETDARVDLFIGFAGNSINADVWGTLTDQATSYLTAHMLARANAGGAGGGPVTTEKVGELSRSYGQLGGQYAEALGELALTSYGVEYARLRRQIPVTPMLTGC